MATSTKIVELDDINFKSEVLESDKPVLVDFWAEWCSPCVRMGPVLDEIAEENDGYKVAKLNVDNFRDLSLEYNVISIPAFLVFKDGVLKEEIIGQRPKEQLLAALERAK